MKKRNLTLIFRSIEQEHLGKDVFLVPYYLGRRYGMNVNIVYSQTKTNGILPRRVRGAKLIPLRNMFIEHRNEILRNLVNIVYIISHAFTIDTLVLFYFSIPTAIIGAIYKKLNKDGMLYIKSDGRMGEWPLLGFFNSIKNRPILQTRIKKNLYTAFLNSTNFITVETNAGYKKFCTERFLNFDLSGKVRLLFNGFDKEQFDLYGINKKGYSEKENIIITVGRIGTYPKNTGMLLKAVESLKFKDWKVVLIGPVEKIENDFQKTIDDFYLSNPELKDHIFFTGPIYDKKELWQWYNKAKVFVLTSFFESFGIVLTEALFFRNYIISTDVGSASDLIKIGYGEIIPQDDPFFLAGVLQTIINKNNIGELYDKVHWDDSDVSWVKLIDDAVSSTVFDCRNKARR
jgi:glycosyltransferase involved in cell wall biosynthesis